MWVILLLLFVGVGFILLLLLFITSPVKDISLCPACESVIVFQ
jgi:hypothetical protein